MIVKRKGANGIRHVHGLHRGLVHVGIAKTTSTRGTFARPRGTSEAHSVGSCSSCSERDHNNQVRTSTVRTKARLRNFIGGAPVQRLQTRPREKGTCKEVQGHLETSALACVSVTMDANEGGSPPDMALMRAIEVHLRAFKAAFPKTFERTKPSKFAAYLSNVMATVACPNAIAIETQRLYEERKHVEWLCGQGSIAQRTAPWYLARRQGLTASDIATAGNRGKFGNKEQLILKKIGLLSDVMSPFAMAIIDHGVIFEEMALRCYRARRQNVVIHDLGLMTHPTIPGFGASPDSVTEWGRNIEVKCPAQRELKGEVPEHYYMQMQGQMSTLGLSCTDYIEAKIVIVEPEELETMPDLPTPDAGVTVRLVRASTQERFSIYSDESLTPKEAIMWAHDEAVSQMKNNVDVEIVRVMPWKLQRIDIIEVPFDPVHWENVCMPIITSFVSELNIARERVDMGMPPWEGYKTKEPGVKRPRTKRPASDPIMEDDDDDIGC